ncbi:MAG: ECF transporter S component [Clostridia bacterium]|nr:ECF transporter S component [Clostridia bacterium]
MLTMIRTKQKLSVGTQALAAVTATVSAVVLPQIFHLLGMMSGLGSALGETFLPMHLPILLVGLLAGPYAGAAAGLLSPLASFALTGMPASAMLPFMMIELCIYGLTSGLLRDIRCPTIGKVLCAQVAGRAVRAVAILLAFYAFGSHAVPVAVIWKSIGAGIFGLILQWVLLPLLMYRIEHSASHDA